MLGGLDGLVGPTDRFVHAIVEHRLLREQTERESERGGVAELVEVALERGRRGLALVVAPVLPVEADEQAQRLGPALDVTDLISFELQAAGVIDGVVVQAGQPGRVGGGRPQLHVAVGLGQPELGQAERLVTRPDGLVVASAGPNQVHHLVEAAGAVGVAGHRREVGAVRPAQHVQGGLVDAAVLAPEQPALDRLPRQVVAEPEDVRVGLEQEAACDEAAEHGDQLALVHSGDLGQHVEGHPSAEHRRGLDHVAFDRFEVVDLAAEDLGQVPRERL